MMTLDSVGGAPLRRVRWSLWSLVAIAVLSAGALNAGLAAEPSPLTGLRVGGSGIVLVGSLALAARVLVGVKQARRRALSRRRTAKEQ